MSLLTMKIPHAVLLIALSSAISLSVDGRPRAVPITPLHLEEITMPGLDLEGIVVSMIYSEGKLVFGQFNGSRMFVVADVQNGSCFSAVLEGRGPGEVVRPDFKSMEPSQGGFVFFDAYGPRQATLSDASIGISAPQKHIAIPHAMNGVVAFRGEYLDVSLQGDRELVAYNSAFTKRREVGKYPKWRHDPSWMPAFAYGKHLVSVSGKDKLFLFYNYYPQIRIYTDVDKRPKDISMDYDGKDSGPKNTYYVVKPVAGEDYVIALTYRGEQNSQRPELQVFNWDGLILARYELDRVVHGMAVDFESGTLYTYNEAEPFSLYRAQIPFNIIKSETIPGL